MREEKPKAHHYSLSKISVSLQQIMISRNSFRAVEKNWKIEIEEKKIQGQETKEKAPSYSVIRQWLGRVALFELGREKEKRDDWIWILDFTLELGVEKCLVVLGIPEEKIREKILNSDGCLNHQDMEVLAIKIMKSTKGILIENVLKELEEKVGKPKQIISDKGSDLYKGIKLYKEKKVDVVHNHDITHKMALLLKKELKEEEKYQLYVKKCNQTRQELQQTDKSFLMPPQQRSKSRYLNLDELIKWGQKIIRYLKKEEKQKKEKEEEREELKKLKLKVGWIREYEESLKSWAEMIDLTRSIEKKIKNNGLNQEFISEYEKDYQKQKQKKDKRIDNLREKIENYLKEEMEKRKKGETIIISSDVIESLFGKYKSFSEKSPLKEIRRMILTIPLSTIKLTSEVIKKGLETVSNIDLEKWEKEIFGQSMLSKRKIALNL